MKIGLIIYGSLNTVSGGYLYDRKLVAFLRQQGDEVTVISLPWSNYGRHLAHNFSRNLYQQLRSADFDVLLQDELNHPSLFWLNRRLKRQVSYPIISIVHHLRSSEDQPRWLHWFYRLVERAYLTSVTGFIFNSQTTRRVVTDLVGERPSLVAPPGGDRFQARLSVADIVARTNEPGPLRLLFVGNVIPRKGLHTLLAALAQLPSESTCLDIVGDTAVDPAYTQMWQQQRRENVKWHGRLSDDELAEKMRTSQLLVVPSHYEGFGIVYLEGMAFGLPAIGTTAGAAGEIIEDGETGFLVDVAAAAALAQRLQQLQDDRTLLLKLSLNAQKQFRKKAGWQHTTASIRRFLVATNTTTRN